MCRYVWWWYCRLPIFSSMCRFFSFPYFSLRTIFICCTFFAYVSRVFWVEWGIIIISEVVLYVWRWRLNYHFTYFLDLVRRCRFDKFGVRIYYLICFDDVSWSRDLRWLTFPSVVYYMFFFLTINFIGNDEIVGGFGLSWCYRFRCRWYGKCCYLCVFIVYRLL